MNLSAGIAFTAAAVNASMAALHMALARAPGWRTARLFAGIALTAALYNILSALFCLEGFPDSVYLASGRLIYLVATLHLAIWIEYAYGECKGSPRPAPVGIRWLVGGVVAAGVVFAATGWLLHPDISAVELGWAGVSYRYPVPTTVGDIYGAAAAALGVIVLLQLYRRYRQGERELAWQVFFYGVFWLCAIEEVLVANRQVRFLSLLDFGFVAVVFPLSLQSVQRIVRDARRLHEVSNQLEAEVVHRTEERDHAQDALLAAEQDIRCLVSGLDAILWEADAETLAVSFLSQGAERLLGYIGAAGGGEDSSFWTRYLHPEDRDRVLEAAREAWRSRTVVSLEYRMIAVDGRVRWFRDSLHPVGASGRLRGIMVDVTESRHAHDALLESEGRLRSLFENSTVGLYRTTPDGRIVMVNPALLSLLGYDSFEELSRRNLEQEGFEPGYARSDFRRRIEQDGVVRGIEAAWTRLDGSTVFIRESARAVRAADGTVLYYDGIVEDITERHRAEEALRESEERFRNMADSAPAIIWISDPQGRATFFNRPALDFTGRGMDELTGTRWTELVHPDDRERLAAALTPATGSGRSGQVEFRLRRAEGDYRWVLGAAIARFSGTKYAGHIGTIVDITDLKRSHEQVTATQKLESLGVLSGGIAHDFNNLLGSILAESELVLADLPRESAAREGLERIKTVSRRAAGIVRQMMAYAGQESADLEPVDLSALIGEMLDLLRVSISKRAVLTAGLEASLPGVHANPAQMRQVVMNLITNASEALGDQEGSIAVATSRVMVAGTPGLPDGDYIRLEVADTGCGMTEEVQTRIYDPFFTTKFAGRGLGLAAVRGIIRAHGGAIQFASAPGAGTRFEVLLPCAGEPVGAGAAKSLPVPDAATRPASSKVLLIEDEDTLRSPVARMLGKRGFAVIEAADGRTALEVFRARHAEIGVVLLDVTLPDMSGGEVFAELCRIRTDAKVILTTAYSRNVAMTAAGSRQPWGFIRKPYPVRDLEELLIDAQTAGASPAAPAQVPIGD